MPDKQIDLIIKLIVENKEALAFNERKKFFSLLTETEINKIEAIIAQRDVEAWL